MDTIRKVSKIKDGFVKNFYTQKKKESLIKCLLDPNKKRPGAASDLELGIISAEPPLSRFWFSDLQDQNVSIISALRR